MSLMGSSRRMRGPTRLVSASRAWQNCWDVRQAVLPSSAAALGLSSLSLPAMGIQKQIDNLKSKLQETQDRRKRQEDLIMKVENLALKVRALLGSLQTCSPLAHH